METQECLASLDKTLIEEGVSDEERASRVQILKESIEFAEDASAKLKAKEEKRIKIDLRACIEWCIISFLAGGLAMAYAIQQAQAGQ